MKGELHPFQEPLVRRTSASLCLLSWLWMTAPMSYTMFSGVATPETAMGRYTGGGGIIPFSVEELQHCNI